ncbi:unnamed protein product [Penicillium egyptiacum]|uniref:F-box domain-containing protein n=1 Tax=Penicillium egyptiacum TaxID=1303716 RepID=A0A9W4P648_9EURO|nr:unnamed protein product [Penicillium egyptiacum]
MSQQPSPTQPLGIFRLGNLPQELVSSIANAVAIRDRCRLHQTCKSMYSLLADGIMKERQVTARVLAPKQEYERRLWKWSSPYTIAGIDMPDMSAWRYRVRFLRKPNKSEIFACAIERGDYENVRKYLRSGVDPNVYSPTGGFMLHVAVAARRAGMVTLLLEYGADPSYVHFDYDSDRFSAFSLGRESYFFYTLSRGGDLALILAFASSGKVDGFANYVTRHGSYATILACINAGMDFNLTSSKEETVAHALADRNDPVLFREMAPHLTSETMTRVSEIHMTPLHVALKRPTPDVAMELIEAGADTNFLDKSIDTTLFTALENGHFEAARLMLERKTNPPLDKYIGGREILAAISACDVGIIRTLIHRGASKEQDGNEYTSPLICAVRTGSLEIVQLVYEEGLKQPSLRYNPGKLFSPSAYASALALGKPDITDYLESCMDRDGSDPNIPCIPGSGTHANMARKIMEVMSDLHHLDQCIFGDEGMSKTHLVNQIALRILPLAGADFDSGRICDLVRKAQYICPDEQVRYPSMYALEGAIKDLELPGEEEEAGEGECAGPDNAGLLWKALPRLLSVIRKEVDSKRRTFSWRPWRRFLFVI